MNHLAHLLVTPAHPCGWVGALLGDIVKGELGKTLAPDLRHALQLHRAVDTYTDNHPAVKTSKQRLGSDFRLISGVMIDVYYDYILANNFDRFCAKPLDLFCQDVYRGLSLVDGPLPQLLDHLRSGQVRFKIRMRPASHHSDPEQSDSGLAELERSIARMVKNDYLADYRKPETVQLALLRMAQRLTRPTRLAQGYSVLLANRAGLEQDFLRFFPELLAFVESR